ncbi:hypothetical protein F4802DRAFT_111511 [Xylaria palmicola]|nr:hypothetical protein F4802DRAFT_111511 [Xylaria palmicola]
MSASIPAKDIRPIKRFITTHDDDGNETFSDVIPEGAPFKTLSDGAEFNLCYTTDRFPVQMEADGDVQTYRRYTENLPGITIPTGTVLRVVDIPPGFTSPMHRTISLDYGVVIEGEIELLLGSGESRLMDRGDIAIQRGTNHAWRNRSATGWARMLYVLQPAEALVVGGEELRDNTHEMIPEH